VTHPSQPNYLALWAASTLGVTDDDCPPAGAPYAVENLGHACEAAGLTWKSYCENLPSAGSTTCATADSLYARKHHPCPDFSNLTHSRERRFSQLATDIAAGTLPNLSFVVPNMCNDMHDCPASTGDDWLSNHLPAMIAGAGPQGLVILTWDEDDDDESGNHILTVFAGPVVRSGYVSATTFNHYTTVRTICDVLGLSPFANASSETTPMDVWQGTVDVEPRSIEGLSLSRPTPNPFRNTTSVTLGLGSGRFVRAFVTDCAGRRVRSLFAEWRAGNSAITWDGSQDDGRPAAPGLYFLNVTAGGDQLVRRLALVR
jgi:acid phosphatase